MRPNSALQYLISYRLATLQSVVSDGVRRWSNLRDVFMSNDERDAPQKDGKPISFRIGGREIRAGDSLSPEEADELVRQLIKQSGGPVTIKDVNRATGITIQSTVEDWSEVELGPKLNEDYYKAFRGDLARKGYLAFDAASDGIRYHTPFRTLVPRYFEDFKHFVPCQKIPSSYFGPVLPGESWFVSHRWATPTHPDPSGDQFEIVKEFMHRRQVHGVWYDYSCIPQEPHTSEARKLFEDSLKHMNSLIVTANFMSLETDDYLDRAWCYYERVICELLCLAKRARIAPHSVPDLNDDMLYKLVVERSIPSLKAEKSSDLPFIKDLLSTGVEMFKVLAIGNTFTLLNSFGFQFGVGMAARLSRFIKFERFWMIWCILAGSSEGSGIRLPDLLNEERLRTVLTHRHERFGTHARFYGGLRQQIAQGLDMRIVEQDSLSRLSSLLDRSSWGQNA